MKTLVKIDLNKSKLLNNEELLNLRGGDEYNCGTGYTFYHCDITYEGGTIVNDSHACVPDSVDPNVYISSLPYVDSASCDYYG